jgi:hypothetical protein
VSLVSPNIGGVNVIFPNTKKKETSLVIISQAQTQLKDLKDKSVIGLDMKHGL